MLALASCNPATPAKAPVDFTITKANCKVGTDNLPAATQIEYELSTGEKFKLEWSAGCFEYGKYDEIGVAKTNGYVKLVSLPAGRKVASLSLDFYKYENAKVYASEGGAEITGEAGTPSGLTDGIMKDYTINGSSFYIGNSSSYAQAFYSITVHLK